MQRAGNTPRVPYISICAWQAREASVKRAAEFAYAVLSGVGHRTGNGC
jgi:hypothetical protein